MIPPTFADARRAGISDIAWFGFPWQNPVFLAWPEAVGLRHLESANLNPREQRAFRHGPNSLSEIPTSRAVSGELMSDETIETTVLLFCSLPHSPQFFKLAREPSDVSFPQTHPDVDHAGVRLLNGLQEIDVGAVARDC
jgi:hypothetical protein